MVEKGALLHYEGNWKYSSITRHVRVVIVGDKLDGSPKCLERSKVLNCSKVW